MGDGDRHRGLHRLQCLRRRLPGREQCADRRAGRNRRGPRHALAAHRRLRRRWPAGLLAGPVHALRARAVRAGLSGGGLDPRQRGAERAGLQPLRRHAVLPVELSLQGAPLQFLRLCRRRGIRQLRRRYRQGGIQSRRHGARPRRHGEMHLLRPAHQPGAPRRREGGSHDPRRRGRHGLPGGLSDAGDQRSAISPMPNAARQRAARRAARPTRCSANSARGRAPPISRACTIPIRTSERRSHDALLPPSRTRKPRRSRARWTLPSARSLEAVNALVTRAAARAPAYGRGGRGGSALRSAWR